MAEKVGTLIGKVIDLGARVTDKLMPVLKPLAEFMAGNIKDAIDNVIDVVDALSALLSGDFTGAWKSIENVIYRMVNKIIKTITSIGTAIAGFMDPFIQGFKDAINSVIGFWNDLGIHIPENRSL